jgi:hypothetical protein
MRAEGIPEMNFYSDVDESKSDANFSALSLEIPADMTCRNPS